jgi:hypothetical protein
MYIYIYIYIYIAVPPPHPLLAQGSGILRVISASVVGMEWRNNLKDRLAEKYPHFTAFKLLILRGPASEGHWSGLT